MSVFQLSNCVCRAMCVVHYLVNNISFIAAVASFLIASNLLLHMYYCITSYSVCFVIFSAFLYGLIEEMNSHVRLATSLL